MNEDPAALLPEVFLAASAVVGLLAGAWLPRRRQWLVRALALVAVAGALVASAVAVGEPARVVFGTSYAVDTATNATRLIVLAALALVLVIATDEFAADKREAESVVLMQLGALGAIVFAGANDVLLLFAAYLLASVPLYALAGFRKDASGTEAALKYYLVGALLGVLTLTGIAILYGATRATGYQAIAAAAPAAPAAAVAVGAVGVLAGLLFKSGGVPAHFWVPDVADGAAPSVAAFVTTLPKIGALVAVYRFAAVALDGAAFRWPLLLALLAAASMTLGNLAAFFQTSAKRLLAYSTISQVGYLLMAAAVADRSPLAQKTLLLYLAAYAAANLGAFAVVAELPQATALADYRGLARRHPGLAAVLVVCLLALVGTPPTGVFFGKLGVFSAAVDGGYAWLAVLAVVNTVASLFYYLRWLAPAVLGAEAPDTQALVPAGRWARLGAYAAATAALVLGPLSGVVMALFDGALWR